MMATERERPYSQFNFLVDVGGGTEGPKAGFQEVSGLGMEINVAEYRPGNLKDNTPMKITGTYKVPDITLKRGAIGALDLYSWLDQVRNGKQDQLKTVTISLQNEDHSAVVMTWKLTNARPIKYTGPSLNGKGTDLAIEELVLACERIDMA
jgi:phage tail-like protein